MNGPEADRVNSLSGVHCAVTEESQAQTKTKKVLLWGKSCPRDMFLLGYQTTFREDCVQNTTKCQLIFLEGTMFSNEKLTWVWI